MKLQKFNPFASIEGSKIFAILCLLVAASIYTAVMNSNFLLAGNIGNVLNRTALFGILSIGVAFVIITGGIDLSIGSVVCLSGVLLPWLCVDQEWSIPGAVIFILAMSAVIGLAHGLLITKVRLQPFVVTLCGLLLYRGIARGITSDVTQGFGSDERFAGLISMAKGTKTLINTSTIEFSLRNTVLFLIVIAVLAMIVLNRTVFGRYLFAIGSNAEAARYSGINVDRVTTAAYVICSTLAGLGGILFVLDLNSAQAATFGNFFELYAIAAAVLGGCSLRGGEGNVLGVVIGAAVMQVLYNTITMVHYEYQSMEFAIIGGVILAGVAADALIRRFIASRSTK